MDDLLTGIIDKYGVQNTDLGLGDLDCRGVDLTAQIDLLNYPGHNELRCRNDAYELEWERRGRSVTGKRKAHNITSAEELYDMPEIGDVKTSLQTADHSGWYLLDGRAVSGLTSAAQSSAASLGYGSNLPNVSDSYLRSGGGSIGQVTGVNTKTISQSNLPNITLSGTTDTAGSHVHTLRTGDGGGGNLVPETRNDDLNGATILGNNFIAPAGDHIHNVSVPLGGAGTPIDVAPRAYVVNYFVWLGSS